MKSLRLSFVLLLIFSVVTISATAERNNVSLTFEKDNGKVLVSDSFSEVFFKKNKNSLEIVGLGEVKRVDGVGVKTGEINGSVASHLEIPFNKQDFVVETQKNGSSVVRVGKLEELVGLKKQENLVSSEVNITKMPGIITFSFSEQPEKVRYFSLKGPDRIVFDFIGIKGSMNKQKGVRSANHPSGFRVVIDKNIPQYFAVRRNNGYSFEVEGRKSFAAFTSQKNETPEKKIVEKKPDNKLTEITGLAFIGEDPEILKINTVGKVEIEKKIVGKKVAITIKNAFISKDKEQVVDASSLNGPVSEIAVYNEGDSVKVLAKMKTSQFVLDVDGMKSGTEFVFSAKKEKIQKVAGYSDAQIVRLPESAVGQEGDDFKTGAIKMGEDERKYSGKKINLDFKEVEILDVLRLMADISKLNIIAGDDVKGNVTVRLVDIPWDEALDVILKSKSLGKERFGNIIRVATLRTMQREKEEELAKKNAQKKLEPIKVRLIAVNYAMAAKLTPQIKELLTERGTVSTDERTNVIIVKDVEETLDKAEQLIEYLDTQTPQVLIEARIVEATSTAAEGLGIEWGTDHTYTDANGHPTGVVFPYNMGAGGSVSVPGPADKTGTMGFTFGSVGMINNLNLTLNVMESEGRIKIVSSPKVATLDNTEAMIQQGVSIPITTRGTTGEVTTKYVDASLILKATPHITADGSILMNLNINKSEPDWSNANYLGEPSIIKKETKTDVLVKSGDTVVIGGVYTNKTSKTVRGVPLLSKIPILGWLFKSEETRVERSELLIFLTPRIMNKVKSSMPMMTSEAE